MKTTCERCSEVFASKYNLLKHFGRKFICTPIDIEHDIDIKILINKIKLQKPKTIYDCQVCNKSFATKQSLKRHCTKCKDNNIDVTYFKEKTDMEKELDECKAKIKSLEDKLNTNIIQNNNNTNNNIQINKNVQIVLQNFGNENLNHLTNQFLDTCLLGLNTGMKNLLKEIHFNPNVPENHNIRCLSKKQNTLEHYSDGTWHPCDKNNTLDTMIRNGYRILFRHFSNNPLEPDTKDQQQRIEYINDYLTTIMRKEGNSYYELRRDLYMLILDGNFYIIGK